MLVLVRKNIKVLRLRIRTLIEKVTHDTEGNITIVDRIKDIIKVRIVLGRKSQRSEARWRIFFR